VNIIAPSRPEVILNPPSWSPEEDTTDYSAPFNPSPEEEADQLGYHLVMAGEDPSPPRGWPFGRLVSFFDGVQAGWREQAMEAVARRWDFESAIEREEMGGVL